IAFHFCLFKSCLFKLVTETFGFCSSGKCQIIHWRQGHKEECHPPNITQQINEVGSKLTDQDGHEINCDSFETEGRCRPNPIETFTGEPVFSKPGGSPESPHEKVDDTKAEFLQDSKGTNSDSETSSVSFSGFSASTTNGESDDVSVGESTDSNESGGSDVHLSVDNPVDRPDTSFITKNMNQSQPLSPKFASLVYSVDHLTKVSNLNQTKSDCSDRENECTSASSLGLGSIRLCEDSNVEHGKVSSGFWGTTLDPIGSTIDASDKSALSNSHGFGDAKLSHSGSVLRFSFNLSETTPLHEQGAGVKGILADDALPCASQITKFVHGAASSENISADAPKVVKHSASLNHGGSGRTDNETSFEVKSMPSSSSHVHLSSSIIGNSRSTDALNVSNLPSLRSESLKHGADDPASTSHLLKSREVGCLSSSAQGSSVPVIKPGKVDGVHTSAAVSSEVRSSSPNARSGLKTSVRKVVDQ
ncbi:hypothetical protein F2P56_025529, partial [Juglans regia]